MADVDIKRAYMCLNKGSGFCDMKPPVTADKRTLLCTSYLSLVKLLDADTDEYNTKTYLGYDSVATHILSRVGQRDMSIALAYIPEVGVGFYLRCWGDIKLSKESVRDIEEALKDNVLTPIGEEISCVKLVDERLNCYSVASEEERTDNYSYCTSFFLPDTESPDWALLIGMSVFTLYSIKKQISPGRKNNHCHMYAPEDYWGDDDEYKLVSCTNQGPLERDSEVLCIRKYDKNQYFFYKTYCDFNAKSDDRSEDELFVYITVDRDMDSCIDKWIFFYNGIEVQEGTTNPIAYISPYIKGFIYVRSDIPEYWIELLRTIHPLYFIKADEEYLTKEDLARESFSIFQQNLSIAINHSKVGVE